jgi:CubicO group peptidase (beta-lactamase class C family)
VNRWCYGAPVTTSSNDSLIIPERLEALVARCRREVDEGRLPGYQLAVGFDGEVAYFEAYGAARDDHRFHTYSAVKPTVSLTLLELAAEGALGLDDPVSSILESFVGGGKDQASVSQVLLHAGGFPTGPMSMAVAAHRPDRLERYRSWHTTFTPGSAFEYHPTAAHWVLADIIEQVSGRPYADVITERVMEPAGVSRWLAIPQPEQDTIVDVFDVGAPTDPVEFAAQFGFEPIETEVTNDALKVFNQPEVRELGVPGGGGVCSAAEMAGWYQAILHDQGNILRPEVRQDALTVVRQRHPDFFGVSANRTHAFVLAGDDGQAAARGHGHTVSAGTFGHGGARGQIGWADPVSGVSLGFMTNGLERNELVEGRRTIAISSRAGLLTTPI